MKNSLLATSMLAMAGAVAAGPASAADKLSVGLSGYMEQWVGMTDIDNHATKEGAIEVVSDSEFTVKGSLESDSGLKFSVKIEVEGNSEASQIDESVASISGEFGTVHIGAEDDVHSIMHYGQQDVGVGLNDGDVKKWLGTGTNYSTSGWRADNKKLIYYSPRIGGVQMGAAYTPNTASEAGNGSGANDNDDSAWSAAMNYKSNMGDTSVAISFGHYSESKGGSTAHSVMPGLATDSGGMTRGMYDAHMALWNLWENQPADAGDFNIAAEDNPHGSTETDGIGGTIDSLQDLQINARASKALLMGVETMDVMKGMEDETFTNVGLQVGFGAFSFNVAYGMADKPMTYSVMDRDVVQLRDSATASENLWDHDGDGCAAATCSDDLTPGVTETAAVNDPSNDLVRSMVVKDPSADYDIVTVGAMYADGPMAASIGFAREDRDNGTGADALMISLRYTLAPGVESRTSVIRAEDGMVEGTGFVTGIKIGF